jgi:hypothetical protein
MGRKMHQHLRRQFKEENILFTFEVQIHKYVLYKMAVQYKMAVHYKVPCGDIETPLDGKDKREFCALFCSKGKNVLWSVE